MNSRWDDATAADPARARSARLRVPPRSAPRRRSWSGAAATPRSSRRSAITAGREVRVLRVKGSGSDLKSIQKKDFPGVRMDDVLALLERQDMGDQEMVDYLRFALQDPGGSRPSIETLLHGFLPADGGHPHACRRGRLAHQQRPHAGDVLRDSLWRRGRGAALSAPGLPHLAGGRGHPRARGRGCAPSCWRSTARSAGAATVKEAYLATIELISRAEEAIAHRAKGRARFGGVDGDVARRRTSAGAWPWRWRRICAGWWAATAARSSTFDDAPDVLEFAGSREAAALCTVGPATPDHTIYTKRLPCFVPVRPAGRSRGGARRRSTPRSRASSADYTAYFDGPQPRGRDAHRSVSARGRGEPGSACSPPARIGAPRASSATSTTTRSRCSAPPPRFGRYVSLSAQDAFDVEYWPLELYKLAQAPPEKRAVAAHRAGHRRRRAASGARWRCGWPPRAPTWS